MFVAGSGPRISVLYVQFNKHDTTVCWLVVAQTCEKLIFVALAEEEVLLQPRSISDTQLLGCEKIENPTVSLTSKTESPA